MVRIESLINIPGMPSLISESLDIASIQNLAVSVRGEDPSELAFCVEEKKRLQRYQKGAFEVMKCHRVASRFKRMYPEFPQRFIYSLPCVDLDLRVGDYIDNVPNRALGDHVVGCGIDCFRRPFVGAKTTSGEAVFINGRYRDDLSSAPRTGGNRCIFADPDDNDEGSYTVVYDDMLRRCARRFMQHAVTMEGDSEDDFDFIDSNTEID